MTLHTSFPHATNYRNPFLRTLIPSVGLAYGIQAAVAIPSILAGSERFYDLSGSLTYLSCTALSLYLPAIRARATAAALGAAKPAWPSLLAALSGNGGGPLGFNWRQVALSAAVGIWAMRCTFSTTHTRLPSSQLYANHAMCSGILPLRSHNQDGHDSRFDSIRTSPPKFLGAFFAQATWVSLCLLPVLALNSLPATTFTALPSALAITDVIGLLLYVGGLSFEVTADWQKSQWSREKREKKHEEGFLTRGLWGMSRHPNYFGECTLWTGIATVSAGVLASGAGQVGMGMAGGIGGTAAALAIAGVSPAFLSFLLLKVSGVPMSENKYDKRYGDREDYQKWKRETPMFFPKLW